MVCYRALGSRLTTYQLVFRHTRGHRIHTRETTLRDASPVQSHNTRNARRRKGAIMQRLSATSMLHTLLLTASAIVVCLLHPGLSNAASPKVDVCHQEGNGSFQLVTVAYQAVKAHREHGDALPGEGVPGLPGYRFTAACAEEFTSWCPCDYSQRSAGALIVFGGTGVVDRCLLVDGEGLSLRVYTYDRAIKDPQALRLVGAQECAVFTPDGQLSKAQYGMGGPGHRQRALEEEDCRTDLLQAAASLGLDQCN